MKNYLYNSSFVIYTINRCRILSKVWGGNFMGVFVLTHLLIVPNYVMLYPTHLIIILKMLNFNIDKFNGHVKHVDMCNLFNGNIY